MQINSSEISPEVQQAKLRLGIVGNAPALIAAVQRAIKVAPIDLSVLITGESGTGKEFFPQIIHQFSSRKHSKYIAVNCGAIPEGTIDSELFGHVKGAFTGAVDSRKGYFEEADGGTIFLDEVAELPLTTQARLLRVLESGEFIKVGSSQVQKTNIRVVAATNVDMVKAVEEGRFREDLFYRLSTVQITIPPLRNRGNDILLLSRKFVADFAEKYRMPVVNLDDSARRALLHFQWPGNVRQLKNVVEQIALFEAGNDVDDSIISAYLPENATVYTPALKSETHNYSQEREMLFNMIFRLQREIEDLRDQLGNHDTGSGTDLMLPTKHSAQPTEMASSPLIKIPQAPHLMTSAPSAPQPTHDNNTFVDVEEVVTSAHSTKTLSDTEKETIIDALERNGGRRNVTAKELNISERTLYRKIKEYGIE